MCSFKVVEKDGHKDKTAMTLPASFDPGNMATPPSQPKRTAWDDGDDASVTVINFSKKPKYEKSTHPDAFPADKNKFMSTVKPFELKNWRTAVKIGLWGLLFNLCVKYDGPLLVELKKLCEVSK